MALSFRRGGLSTCAALAIAEIRCGSGLVSVAVRLEFAA